MNYDAGLEGLVKRSFSVNQDSLGVIRDASVLNDEYSTANAARVLLLNTRANLKISQVRAAVGTTSNNFTEGDVVQIIATLKNESAFNIAAPFKIRWFDGDPANGGVAIGSDETILEFVANTTLEKTITIDTTGRSGLRNIYLVADVENAIIERTELDNVLAQTLDMAPAPLAADLIMISPVATPSQLVGCSHGINGVKL